AEVDRAEVEAVDHWGRRGAAVDDPIAPGQVVVYLRSPGDVVHGAGALDAGLLGRRVVGPQPTATVPARLPAEARGGKAGVLVGREAQCGLEQRAAGVRRVTVGTGCVEAL